MAIGGRAAAFDEEPPMAIKTIAVPLTGNADAHHVALCALKLAEEFAAHVTAGCISAPFTPYFLPETVSVAPDAFGALYTSLVELDTVRRTRARADFDRAVAVTRTPIVSAPACTRASTSWLEAPHPHPDGMGVQSLTRLADLVVIEQPTRAIGSLESEVFEGAVFAARKPVVVVPAGATHIRRSRAAVAWDGGIEAVIAVQRALSFLQPGAEVCIIQVGSLRSGRASADDLADYLRWHGFASTIRRVADRPASTGEIILAEARSAKADVLIAGAYSHSRAREQLFGGVTRHLLAHTDLPLFMAH